MGALHRDPSLYEHAVWAMPASDADAGALLRRVPRALGAAPGSTTASSRRRAPARGSASAGSACAPRRRGGGAQPLLPAHGARPTVAGWRPRRPGPGPRTRWSGCPTCRSSRPAARRTTRSVRTAAHGRARGRRDGRRRPRATSRRPRCCGRRGSRPPESFDEQTRESLLDLWCAVNDAGGAVGFLPRAPRHQVARRSRRPRGGDGRRRHDRRAPAGCAGARVVGAGFWVADRNPLLAHARTAYRVMTHPDLRGRNLGRLLLAAMHRVAREQGSRSRCSTCAAGWGRPGSTRRAATSRSGGCPASSGSAPGDDRDSVLMARRLDGRPMVADGRA